MRVASHAADDSLTPAEISVLRLIADGNANKQIAVGGAAGWIGLWIVFGRVSSVSITIALAAVVGVHLFVVFYEEPTLRRKFGAEYEEYCRNVHRWWPRMHGWDNPK